jgi:cytochrome P450
VSLADLAVDPHAALASLRDISPVEWIDELGGWIVTSRALCVDVLTRAEVFTVDDERFSTRRVVGPSMLSLDGSEHSRHRGAFGGAFRARAVRESLEAWTTGLAASLVDEIAPAGQADLRERIALPLATEVMRRILGLDVSSEELSRWNVSITAAIDEVTAGGSVPDYGIEAFGELRDAVADSAGGASLLADAGDRGLDIDEVAANVAVLLIGGIVTADGAISILFRHLLDRPRILGALAESPDLIPKAVEESLRLEPAAAFVDRYAKGDVDLGGAHIAGGDLVRVSIAAANRDPVVFEQPDVFDVHRPNLGEHLAFVRGPHACLGIHVAKLEARVALEAVLESLQDLRNPEDPGPPPSGLIFRAPETVPALWAEDSGTIS